LLSNFPPITIDAGGLNCRLITSNKHSFASLEAVMAKQVPKSSGKKFALGGCALGLAGLAA
jgi:hypothetical protein